MYDVLLKNGLVIDGTGEKPFYADVAVENGRIAAIAPHISQGLAAETVDVTGLCVIPGIIDIHSHSDLSYIRDDRCEAKLYQGVTSELCGQCGSTPYPCLPENKARIARYGNTVKGNFAACSFENYVRGVQDRGDKMSVNLMPLVGHCTLRSGVMEYSRRLATSDEIKQMRALLRADMEAGAWGLSLGLGYEPSKSADGEELCLLGQEIAPYDGIIPVHLRNQGADTPQSLEEIFEINRRTGAHVHIAHFKVSHAVAHGRAPEFVQIVRAAQKAGVHVTVDMYPYTAATSRLTRKFPEWSLQGGAQKAVQILKGPERAKLVSALEDIYRTAAHGDSLRIVSTYGVIPGSDGKSLRQISEMWGVSQGEALARITTETDARCRCVAFCMCESDVDHMMSQNDFSIGSDGSALSFGPALVDGKPHPRNYGTFPRFLRLAREKKICPPEIAVRRITGLSADSIGIKDRGYLREGLVADIAVINMETVADRATYEDPFQKPEGVIHVLMDGQFALRNGVQTEKRLGKILMKR